MHYRNGVRDIGAKVDFKENSMFQDNEKIKTKLKEYKEEVKGSLKYIII